MNRRDKRRLGRIERMHRKAQKTEKKIHATFGSLHNLIKDGQFTFRQLEFMEQYLEEAHRVTLQMVDNARGKLDAD